MNETGLNFKFNSKEKTAPLMLRMPANKNQLVASVGENTTSFEDEDLQKLSE